MRTKGVLRLSAILLVILICTTSLATRRQDPPKPKEEPPPSREQRPPTAEQDEVIEVNTNLVNVPVSVLDRDGRFVPDLKQDEFRVYEEGIEQEIAFFAPVESSFSVVLLIDISPSTRDRRKEIRAAALSFVDQLRPDDNVMVVSFSGDIQVVSSATKDRVALRKAIRELSWEGSGTLLYGTVDALMNRFFRPLRGRKALVMLTDGEDSDARLKALEYASKAPRNVTVTVNGPTCSQVPCATYQDNMRDAEELDALIYPIRFGRRIEETRIPEFLSTEPNPERQSDAPLTASQLGEIYLRQLASKTGGRYYSGEKGEDLTVVFNSIANELRHQYSLGYYVKTKADPGQRRQIRVRVTRPNLAVRSKPSYVGARQRAKRRFTPSPAP